MCVCVCVCLCVCVCVCVCESVRNQVYVNAFTPKHVTIIVCAQVVEHRIFLRSGVRGGSGLWKWCSGDSMSEGRRIRGECGGGAGKG